MDPVKSSVTNEQVAKDLGLSHSMVSRLRSGGRNPSFETMIAIERKLKWLMEDQIRARTAGRWDSSFEELLAKTYDQRTLVHQTQGDG
jgi:transcriptional regulator with XRE-family HTH domain